MVRYLPQTDVHNLPPMFAVAYFTQDVRHPKHALAPQPPPAACIAWHPACSRTSASLPARSKSIKASSWPGTVSVPLPAMKKPGLSQTRSPGNPVLAGFCWSVPPKTILFPRGAQNQPHQQALLFPKNQQASLEQPRRRLRTPSASFASSGRGRRWPWRRSCPAAPPGRRRATGVTPGGSRGFLEGKPEGEKNEDRWGGMSFLEGALIGFKDKPKRAQAVAVFPWTLWGHRDLSEAPSPQAPWRSRPGGRAHRRWSAPPVRQRPAGHLATDSINIHQPPYAMRVPPTGFSRKSTNSKSIALEAEMGSQASCRVPYQSYFFIWNPGAPAS